MPASPDDALARRRLLKLGSGGALALVIGGGAGWLDRRGSDAPAAGSAITAPTSTTTSTTTTTTVPLVIGDLGEVDPSIVTIGRRVVEITGITDAGTLYSLLPSAEGDPVTSAAASVAAEFRAGDTIVVDGWVLAASEARAAAVIALLCGDEC